MTDVVIIGGGVIGLAIAREASRSGLETIVLEKNELWWDVKYTHLNNFNFWFRTHKKVFWHNKGVTNSILGADHSIVMSHIFRHDKFILFVGLMHWVPGEFF